MKKILYVAKSGLYDYEREALKKHTKSLGEVVSIKTEDLSSTRMDHADVIIYFDDTKAGFYNDIAFSLEIFTHAAMMALKGIKAIVITKSGNPGEVICRIWFPGNRVTEMGQVGEMWYRFHSNEKGPTRTYQEKGFNSMDWADFENRFVNQV